MASKLNLTNNEVTPPPTSLLGLYLKYSLTYLSVGDMYTYEIIILFVYAVMVIFSFFTNFIAIIVFLFGRRSRSELSPFLLNLSVFNIIMTVYCIPFTITSVIFQRWLYARELCVVLDGLKTFSVTGVLLTLITIAIDRYCVVKYPLNIKIYSVRKRNLIALTIIWTLSIGLAILWSPARSLPMREKRLWVNSRSLLYSYLNIIENVNDLAEYDYALENLEYRLVDTIQCVPNKITRPVEVRRIILNFLQTYFVPLFILGFVYLRIAALLWQRTNDRRSSSNGTSTTTFFIHESIQFKKKLKQGIKMLVVVVVLYAVLWLPMNVFQLCLNLLCYPNTKHQSFCNHTTLIQLLYISAHFLTVSNTAINPIIYGFTNNRFRSDIRQLLHRFSHCQTTSSHYHHPQLVKLPRRETEERRRSREAKEQPLALPNHDNHSNAKANVKTLLSAGDAQDQSACVTASTPIGKIKGTVTRHTS